MVRDEQANAFTVADKNRSGANLSHHVTIRGEFVRLCDLSSAHNRKEKDGGKVLCHRLVGL